MNLQDFYREKVVIVTGSSRGIGRETARLALRAGARVVLNGRNAAALEATRSALGATDRILSVAADLSRPEEARRLVAETLTAWGQIDVLINNAGLSMRGDFVDLSTATVHTMIDANFLTAVWATQAALPSLREARGRVVFVSSLAGLRGFPGVSLYSASKMALTALHQSLQAEERPHGVTSSLIYLAFTENDPEKTVMNAEGRHFRHERRWAMTQADTARAILEAGARGRKRTVLTPEGWALSWGQSYLPGLVDRFVGGSRGTLHRVKDKNL